MFLKKFLNYRGNHFINFSKRNLDLGINNKYLSAKTNISQKLSIFKFSEMAQKTKLQSSDNAHIKNLGSFIEESSKKGNDMLNTSSYKNLNQTSNDNADNQKYFQTLFKNYLGDPSFHELDENKFDLFLDKMQNLIQNEKIRQEKNDLYAQEIKQISLQSKESLRDILVHYQSYRNDNGFDAEAVSQTILILGKTYSARGKFHRCYSDMTHWELINSYRFNNLIEDIKFAIVNPLAYLNGNQFANIIKGIKFCNYKNTELATLIEQRIASIVYDKIDFFEDKYQRFADLPGVGKKDFFHINKYAENLTQDKNFLSYIKKLIKIDFKEEEPQEMEATFDLNKDSQNISNNEAESILKPLEESILKVFELTQLSKDLKYNFTDNINNLVNQFFIIEQSLIDNSDLAENPYIKHSLQKIEDKFLEIGFIDVNTFKTISSEKLSEDKFKALKIETVMKILRDYIYVNFPDIFSSILENLEATQLKVDNECKLNFTKYRMTPANLSECLKELSEYCKITNIDINGDDYENKELNFNYYDKDIPEKPVEHIKTKAQYTKLYNVSQEFFFSIKKELIKKYKNLDDFTYHANLILSYSNINLISKELIDSSTKGCLNYLSNEKSKVNNEDIATLLYGYVLSGYEIPYNLLSLALKKFDFQNVNLNFDSTLKFLWALLSFEVKIDDKIITLVRHMNSFNVMNHLTEDIAFYQNINILNETTLALKEFAKKSKIESKDLDNLFIISNKFFENKFTILKKEELNVQDPLKENIKKFFIEMFFKNKIDNTSSILKNKENTLEFEKLCIPLTSDFVLDIYGNKVCIFLNSLDKESGLHNFNGSQRLMKNILENFYNCICVFIPISRLIKFDINSLKLQVNETSGLENMDKIIFSRIIKKRPKLADNIKHLTKHNAHYNKLISEIVNSKTEELDLILNSENKENLEIFFKNLVLTVDLNNRIIYNTSYPQLKGNLLELKKVFSVLDISFQLLSDNFKNFIAKRLKFEDTHYSSFKEFLLSIIKEYEKYYENLGESKNKSEKKILTDESWIGKRLNVDLIDEQVNSKNILENLKKKNVAIEILNNNYMWYDEYNPYLDWEEEMKANLDHFNYFTQKSNNQYFYNSYKIGNRKLPQGIFPNPNRFRVMKSNLSNTDTNINYNLNNRNQYENEVNKYHHMNEILISEEVKKNNSLINQNFPAQLKTKINLLNMNNCLKQNFTDNEILRYISEFEFTEKLIEEHLGNHKSTKPDIEFVTRNAENFKSFNIKLDNLREQFDEYDKFVMKEYYRLQDLLSYDKNASPEQIKEELESKMGKHLEENYDDDALSIHNPNDIKYNFNIDNILNNFNAGKKESLFSFTGLGSSNNNENFNNAEKYLEYKRRVSERNIILLKIIVKIIQQKPFTNNENLYLKNLSNNISNANILNLESLTIPSSSSKLQIKDISSNDIYALNTLANVSFTTELNNFALSDIIIELNNFLDNTTFNKIIYEIFSESKSKEFKFDCKNHSLFDTDNKEPILLSQEIKENIWRISGFFDDSDKEKLKNFLRIKRGKSTFDKFWLQIDEASLDEFLKEVNLNENRIQYLEQWIKRKEQEFENRFQLPPDNLKLDDTTINKLINKKDKIYQDKILKNIFKIDDLKTLSPRTINAFINEFVEILPLFNFNYPQIIKDIFNALKDLKKNDNIYKEDVELLNTYKTLFKIDQENPNEFLAIQPIKMEQEKLYNFTSEGFLLDKEKIIQRVKNSTIPFVKNISQIILTNNTQN